MLSIQEQNTSRQKKPRHPAACEPKVTSVSRLPHLLNTKPTVTRQLHPVLQTLLRLASQPLAYWIWATVMLGLAVRFLRFAMIRPLWCDEAYLASSILSRDLSGLLSPLDYGQIAPSGFLLLTWINVATWGVSEASLRIPAVIAGMAGLAIFPWAIRPLATREVCWVATVFLSVSIFPVRLASELKPYSMDLFLAVLLLGCTVRTVSESSINQSPRSNTRLWFSLLVLLSILTPWLSFPGVFVAGGMIAGRFFWQLFPPIPRLSDELLVQIPVNDRSTVTRIVPRRLETNPTRWKRALLDGFLVGIPLVLSTLLMWNLFGKQAYEHGDQVMNLKVFWQDAMPRSDTLQEISRWLAEAHTGGMVAYPVGAEHGGSIATTIFLALGFFLLATRNPQRLFLIIPPFALTALAAALHKYPYGGSARIAQHLAPMICLLAAWGVISIFPRKTIAGRRLCRLIVAVVGLGFVAGQGVYFIQKPAKDPNDTSIREALATIYRNTPAQQSIRCAADDLHFPYAQSQLRSEQGAKFRANRLLEQQHKAPVVSTSEKILLFSHKPILEMPQDVQFDLLQHFPPDQFTHTSTYTLVHSNRDGRHSGFIFIFESVVSPSPQQSSDLPSTEPAPSSRHGQFDFASAAGIQVLP